MLKNTFVNKRIKKIKEYSKKGKENWMFYD